jgi:hypothetical protein
MKSKFAFSINCYKELIDLINEVLPMGHKMLKTCTSPTNLLIYDAQSMTDTCKSSQITIETVTDEHL